MIMILNYSLIRASDPQLWLSISQLYEVRVQMPWQKLWELELIYW